nr:uncharacterized protein LOC112029553 isoform X2 [Quercus suber]
MLLKISNHSVLKLEKTNRVTEMAALALEEWGDLEGKVVMVTGASSGLGLGFCLDLAKAGCKIIAAARRFDRLQSLCHQINHLSSSSSSSSPRAVAVELDLTADGPTIEKSVQKAWAVFGHIHALVNNAGIRGTWLVLKYICIRMRDAERGGSIINVSSVAGLDRGQWTGGVAYSSSKAGLNTFTKVMALELGVYKIRVNSISPGLFKSEITQGLMQKDWMRNVERKAVPLREYGTSDPALTSLVRYLVHDSSEYVSGNIFIVDAGFSLPGVPIYSSL